MPAHPHAELMRLYAEDAQTSTTPWNNWQFSDGEEEWLDSTSHPQWDINRKYRRKPRTILINGIEVPEPEQIPISNGTIYYTAEPCRTILDEIPEPCSHQWNNSYYDKCLLRMGLIHLTKKNAVIHAQALISFTNLPE